MQLSSGSHVFCSKNCCESAVPLSQMAASTTQNQVREMGVSPPGCGGFEFWCGASTPVGCWAQMKMAAELSSLWTGQKPETLLFECKCKTCKKGSHRCHPAARAKSMSRMTQKMSQMFFEGWRCHLHGGASRQAPIVLKTFEQNAQGMQCLGKHHCFG